MNLSDLAWLVEKAINDPVKAVQELCGEYYEPYYSLLYLLARYTNGPCVELGVEKGRGSGSMALTGSSVLGIDNNLRMEAKLLAAEMESLKVIEASSLPPPEKVPSDISVLHVDTEHSYAQAREEFWAYKPLLCAGSVVCFDDTHAMEDDVGRFILTLPWQKIFDDRLHSCGYCVMIYDEER